MAVMDAARRRERVAALDACNLTPAEICERLGAESGGLLAPATIRRDLRNIRRERLRWAQEDREIHRARQLSQIKIIIGEAFAAGQWRLALEAIKLENALLGAQEPASRVRASLTQTAVWQLDVDMEGSEEERIAEIIRILREAGALDTATADADAAAPDALYSATPDAETGGLPPVGLP